MIWAVSPPVWFSHGHTLNSLLTLVKIVLASQHKRQPNKSLSKFVDNWKHRLGLECARAALCKWATWTCLSKTFANWPKQAEAKGNSAEKGFGYEHKHCLGISEINSIPEWRVFLRAQQTRADIIHSNREIFDPENSPFPLTQSIKVRRRALVLLPCLIPCLRCENSQFSPFLIVQRDNIHARTHDTCVD